MYSHIANDNGSARSDDPLHLHDPIDGWPPEIESGQVEGGRKYLRDQMAKHGVTVEQLQTIFEQFHNPLAEFGNGRVACHYLGEALKDFEAGAYYFDLASMQQGLNLYIDEWRKVAEPGPHQWAARQELNHLHPQLVHGVMEITGHGQAVADLALRRFSERIQQQISGQGTSTGPSL